MGRHGGHPSQLDHVDRTAIRARIRLLTRRRQGSSQILVTAPALDPESAGPPARLCAVRSRFLTLVGRQLELADLVRRNLAIRFLSFDVLAFCHGPVLLAPFFLISNCLSTEHRPLACAPNGYYVRCPVSTSAESNSARRTDWKSMSRKHCLPIVISTLGVSLVFPK